MTSLEPLRITTAFGRFCAFVSATFVIGLVPAALTVAAAAQSSQPTAAEFGERVLRYARTDLQDWIEDPVLIFAIKEQNALFGTLKETEIASMDQQWIDGGSRGLMVLEMLDRQASIIARDRREKAGGVITEIIVMDQYGLNVAISDRTSDFYQGDEAKYKETYLLGPDAVHISELEFDDSTQQVQTQVSLTVTDPENGEPIGAVTLGVRIDKLVN
ncbi:MAG: hypothetical protein AAFV19_05125 [Pseudomonadota bacterium]